MRISRRLFLTASSMAGQMFRARPLDLRGTQNKVSEWTVSSAKEYSDPFNEVELDFVFRNASGKEWRVPAFWAGEQNWTIRFAPPETGIFEFESVCTDATNPDLHGLTGRLEVGPYQGRNRLYQRGALRVAEGRRHLEHQDGTPFFWLGDTWWGGMLKRLRWPEDFQWLTADRVRKGFNVIQIAAAFPPSIPHGPFDAVHPGSEGDGGYPWEADCSRINPVYWDMADLRIRWLVEQQLIPCIFGAWGRFLYGLGTAKMKQHWRNIVARWGAYPVVWSVCGEVNSGRHRPGGREEQVRNWVEVGRYLREIDPYHRLVTIHPVPGSGRKAIGDAPIIDFDMVQTGHPMLRNITLTPPTIRESANRQPRMPVLQGEVGYEGVFGESPDYHQRYLFWSSVLSGSLVGYTYGAAGIWEVNTEDFVATDVWGHTPWREAAQLPGSGQLRYSRELLMEYPWWEIEPHMEWVEPHWKGQPFSLPFAAGIPGELRIHYLTQPYMAREHTGARHPRLCKLEPGVTYRAVLMDPRTGKRHDFPNVHGDEKGEFPLPPASLPGTHDWVLVLQTRDYTRHADLGQGSKRGEAA